MIPLISQIESLPYLNAIINEVVCLHPEAVQGLCPAPGALVTMSSLTTHMKTEVFDDHYAFRPQRWIDNPSMELFGTQRARDIDPSSNFIIPVPASGSRGLQIKIRE
ncbi:putative cytochrome p450 [Rosellinia necatrix]|uniref:Putative cytochrome p450 n=1 Tax=Rosellinia necatrix TaxID=77044 RepID=A0A1S8A9W6_ROSNE|nr:putative cytochrome p450 [Rosellinia necatrix]